jgi:hypothetical protein
MATIELRLRTLAQLFDSLDPSPFHERGLDRNADAYIVDWAGDFPANAPLRLQLHLSGDVQVHAQDIARAIHAHYAFELEQARRRHRRRMRGGHVALGIGLLVMLACLALRELLGDWGSTPVGQGISEGLLILGWVVLWRPAEVLLFERRESYEQLRLLQRLAHIPVDVAFLPNDAA